MTLLAEPQTPHEQPPLDAKDLEKLSHIEARLELPRGFYATLLTSGSDWEFSIKLAVILESALASVITSTLHNDAVARHVDKLNLDGGRTGKLDLAQSLGVITPLERGAFTAIAEVRNTFAHRVKNVALDLPTFGKSIKQGDLESIQKRLLMLPDDQVAANEHLWRGPQIAEYLRLTLFLSGSWLLAILANQDKHAALEADRIRRLTSAASQRAMRLADLLHTGPTALTATREELNQMFMTPAAEPKPN